MGNIVEQSGVDESKQLRFKLAALEQLFEVYERTAIEQSSKLESLLEQHQLLEKIASFTNQASSVREAMQSTLDLVCAYTRWPVGHVYFASENEDTRQMFSTTIWHVMDGAKFDQFRDVTEKTDFSLGIGIPGKVLASGQPAWITDVTNDPNFLQTSSEQQAGLKAVFDFPVVIRNEVVAVLEFFSETVSELHPSLLWLMSQIGTQLGRIVERVRAAEKLMHDALHDYLTGLPNRALFLDRLERAVSRAKRHRTYKFAVLGSSPRVRGTHFLELLDSKGKYPSLKFHQLFWLSKSSLVRWMKRDQIQSVKFHRQAAARAEGLEFVARFMVTGPGHNDVSVFTAFHELLPDHFAGAPGNVPDIDASTHLQKPDGQSAAQARRNIFRIYHKKAHPCTRCPASPIPSALGMAGETDSGGASGGRIPPAESTSSIMGMIRPRSLLERKMSRQARRTSLSGCWGDFEAIRNATGTTVSNLTIDPARKQ